MNAKTRIQGACKRCKYAYLYYGGGKGTATGVRCVSRNGRVKHVPKEPKDCRWFTPKEM